MKGVQGKKTWWSVGKKKPHTEGHVFPESEKGNEEKERRVPDGGGEGGIKGARNCGEMSYRMASRGG